MGPSFATLSPEQCRERLAAATIGRVAFCTPQGPAIFPVNFGLVDGVVVFRTAPYSHLGTSVVGAQVAFEVDEAKPDEEVGWSVVVHGQAMRIEDPAEATELRRRLPEPWASGQRVMYVRVVPSRMSGRSVSRGV